MNKRKRMIVKAKTQMIKECNLVCEIKQWQLKSTERKM